MQNRCAPINRICCRPGLPLSAAVWARAASTATDLYLSVVWTNIWNTRCDYDARPRRFLAENAPAQCLPTTTTCIIFERGARCIIIKIKPAFMALSFPSDFLVFHIRGGPDLAARKATRGSHSVSLKRECDTFCCSSVKMSTYCSAAAVARIISSVQLMGNWNRGASRWEKSPSSTSFFTRRVHLSLKRWKMHEKCHLCIKRGLMHQVWWLAALFYQRRIYRVQRVVVATFESFWKRISEWC